MSTSTILDLCRTGRITAHQAVMLLELRKELLERRAHPWTWRVRRFIRAILE